MKRSIKNNSVQSLAVSPYILQYTEANVSVIKHRFSDAFVTLKPHQVITNAFIPADFYSEKLATLSLDGSSYTLANLFPAGEGPWRFILQSKSKHLATLTEQPMTNYKPVQTLREDTTFGAQAAKDARKESIEKARATASSKKKQRRTMTVSELQAS